MSCPPTSPQVCAGTAYNHDDVDEFTKGILLSWANHGKRLSEVGTRDADHWLIHPQLPSATAERVFSLLKLMIHRQR